MCKSCICDFLVAQMIKNAPTMWETQIPFLGWEDPLEEVMATHSGILAWRIPGTEEQEGYSPWGGKESDTTEWLALLHYANILDTQQNE